MGETNQFTIRDLETYDEFIQVHHVQQSIWGFAQPGTGLYPPLLLTASRNGGVVLGAFDPEGRMIGYIFSFLGREPGGPLKLCSQTMGVLPEWRGRGVATALKWAQRERALAAGLPLITWTFDPLESANARLNMHKLGGISRRYWRNIYGEQFGALNQGLPTDRLLVEWWIESRRIKAKAGLKVEANNEKIEAVPIFKVEGQGISRRVTAFHTNLDAPCLALEVPVDIQHMKRVDMSLALDWRLRVREGFEMYLVRGYLVTDFASKGRNAYILSRMTDGLEDQLGVEQRE